MAHDIFISYSHHDKPTADAICAKLESGGLRCWYAPRDIAPGADWAASIIDAINASKVFILVFTNYSNVSQQVIREISNAVQKGLPIIPFKLTKEAPSKGMQYYLSTVHWLDAMDGPLYDSINVLESRVRGVLTGESGAAAQPKKSEETMPMNSGEKKKRIKYVIGAAAVVLLVLILWKTGAFNGKSPETPTPIPAETSTEVLTGTPEPTETATMTSSPTSTTTPIPTPTPSPTPTETPSPTPTPTETPTPTPTPTLTPTETPTSTPTPTPAPTETPTPTPAPTETPTPTPTVTPTEEPIDEAYTGLQQMDPTEKKKIQRLIIAGDQVYTNFEQFQFDTGYDERADKGFLRDCNTQDRVLCAPGKLTNLNVLEGMDSLEVLWLIDQPLTSLEGIDQYKNLYEVRLCSCDELEDISPLYNIRNLQNIEIMATPVRSLNGIEKMRKLHIINICGYNMEDISALSRCDYSYAVSRGGFSLRIDWDTGISDYSFMKKIPVFSELWMCDIDPALWINELDQSKVNEITACGAFRINPECFPTLIEILKKDHPEINEIRLESNDTIKDLTGLTELPNLSNVAVSGEMTEAIKSLNGVQYRFTLEVDGVKMNSLTEELNKYGLAESDLSQISDLFICGDHLYYRKLGDKELEIPDDSFPQAKWENPDFIERMTSLGFMELRNVDAEGIPSLSDLHNLNMIWLKRCSFDNMDWLNGSEVSELYILSPRTESYQGLAGCKNLRKLQLTDSTANDISFLKELSGLMELDLSYNTGITDLSGLTELPNLKKVSISSDMEDAIKSLDGLDRKFTLTVDGTVQTKTNEEKTTQDKKSGRIITFGQ